MKEAFPASMARRGSPIVETGIPRWRHCARVFACAANAWIVLEAVMSCPFRPQDFPSSSHCPDGRRRGWTGSNYSNRDVALQCKKRRDWAVAERVGESMSRMRCDGDLGMPSGASFIPTAARVGFPERICCRNSPRSGRLHHSRSSERPLSRATRIDDAPTAASRG